MALNRLGVPPNVIRMIHDLEVDGITVVRTPPTKYIYDMEGMEGLRKLDERVPGILIHPEHGVPQGDTGSPLIWLAVYDTLIRALTIQRSRLIDRLAHTVNYEDDLKSIAGNLLPSLQEHANLVSAFALVFELDQSKAKIWAFYFPFVTPKVHRNFLDQLSILTHTAGWAAAPVMMQNLGTLKNLGYYIDTDLGGDTQSMHTQQRLATALEAMKYKFQGFKAREYALTSVVIAQITYTRQDGNFNELQLQKLDSITRHYTRKEL
jgi:hypothetical protein